MNIGLLPLCVGEAQGRIVGIADNLKKMSGSVIDSVSLVEAGTELTGRLDLLVWYISSETKYGRIAQLVDTYKDIPSIVLLDGGSTISCSIDVSKKNEEETAQTILALIERKEYLCLAEPKAWKQLFLDLFTLQERTSRFKEELFEAVDLVTSYLDMALYKGFVDWTAEFWGKGIHNITGYTYESFALKKLKWKHLIIPEDLIRVKEIFREALRHRKNRYIREYRIRCFDGNIKWIRDQGVLLYDGENNFSHSYGFIVDVTKEKRLFALVENAKKEWEAIMDNIPTLIAVVGDDLTIRRVNKAFADFFGLHPGDIVGKKCSQLFPPEHECLASKSIRELRDGKLVKEEDFFIPMVSGYFQRTCIPIAVKGKLDKIICLYHNITELRAIGERLQALNEELSFVMNAMAVLFIGVDEQGRIFRWNRMSEVIFALSYEGACGRYLGDLEIKGELDRIMEAYRRVKLTKEPVKVSEVKIYHEIDGARILDLVVLPFVHGEETPENFRIFITGFDITEKRNLEMMLVHAQKLESIGALAAGIAHEINTPSQCLLANLTFVKNEIESVLDLIKYCEGLSQKEIGGFPGGKTNEAEKLKDLLKRVDLDFILYEIPASLDQSLDCLEKITKIVSSIKDFSHPGEKERSAVDIHKILLDTIIISKHEWKYVAEIETDFDPELPMVWCYAGEIGQVFLNIIVNAAQAVKECLEDRPASKGRITIKTRKKGSWCEIRISDTGKGIPEGIRHKIFEPFFTTKPAGLGTGQGLAIAQSIVIKKHKGQIYFETEEGKGTSFVVLLPLEPFDQGGGE